MTQHATKPRFPFQPLPHGPVVACCDGGRISAEGGCLLWAEGERRTALRERRAACVTA